MSASTKKLTDHKVLIFDVYGTLADWESGIFNGLQPLLRQYPASKNWSRKDTLKAFMSVETDLQAQLPEMLYSDILAKVHEVLEERLKALSDAGGDCQVSGATLARDPHSAAMTSSAGAGPSSMESELSSPSQNVDEHKAFGTSISNWPIFPDTCSALQRLSKHFKLVVLSNVDRHSFRHTHALLSEGPSWATVSSDVSVYTYPEPNPNRYWHPQASRANASEESKSKSPFTLILTAQDTGCYKPALGGFLSALEYAGTHPELFGELKLGDGEEVKDKALSVAQSIPHDHVAAHRLGMRSVWIDRQSAVTCKEDPEGSGVKEKWAWRFETLGAMADAVDKELASGVSGN